MSVVDNLAKPTATYAYADLGTKKFAVIRLAPGDKKGFAPIAECAVESMAALIVKVLQETELQPVVCIRAVAYNTLTIKGATLVIKQRLGKDTAFIVAARCSDTGPAELIADALNAHEIVLRDAEREQRQNSRQRQLARASR